MPDQSPFRHQHYSSTSTADIQFLTAVNGPQPGSERFEDDLRGAGNQLGAAGVKAIYLLHGTFVGTDAWGWVRKISRLIPSIGIKLHRLQKRALDSVLRDYSNYSDEFEALLRHQISTSASPIDVQRFHWSSENHHIGRADGVVRLLDQLISQSYGREDRILLWAHSHGGNVLALLTQLLAASPADREKFFRASEPYYRTRRGRCDMPLWDKVRRECQRPIVILPTIDIVTFGTPVRYGWSCASVSKLLHFIYHRVTNPTSPERAAFPFEREDFRTAAGGDYIQQTAIAGTDFPPSMLAWRARRANRALESLLQTEVNRHDLFYHLHHGQRAHADGRNLLVDYGPQNDNILSHLAGHVLYTMTEWLHFHITTVADLLYA